MRKSEKNCLSWEHWYVTGVVKSSGNSKTPLQALTCSVSGDPLSEKGMRAIAAQLPGLGGYVDNNHIATGAYGGWTSRPRDFGVDCRYGHIAIALSSEVLGSALQESDRLYRFEVKQRPELNRMHTAIDMGENNLNNAGTVNAKNGNFAEDVTVGRDISSQRWLNSEHGGGFYMADNDWIRAVNDKGITTGGQLKGGTVKAEGRLSTEEFLHLGKDNAVQPGWGCSPNGLVGRTPEGALMSCQSGHWMSGASLQQRQCQQMGNWGGCNFREYRCPVGWYAAGLKFVGHQHEESAYVITCCQ